MNTNQKTVLLVEDEDEISSHITARLTGKGYRVVRARDADDAIELLEQNHLSLILTDLELPTLDLMLDRLREDEKHKDLTVAVIDINHPHNPPPEIKILNN